MKEEFALYMQEEQFSSHAYIETEQMSVECKTM